jgi:hypothetical protein
MKVNNPNISLIHKERTMDNMFQQIVDTSTKMSLKRMDHKIKGKFYLNTSLANYIYFQNVQTDQYLY